MFLFYCEDCVDVMKWSDEQRSFCVKTWFETRAVVSVQRQFRTRFKVGRHGAVPSRVTILRWVAKFKKTASAKPSTCARCPRYVRTPENVARIKAAVEISPQTSARKHSMRLKISDRSVRRMLSDDLKFHPYKLQMTQELQPTDFKSRKTFAKEMLAMLRDSPDLLKKLIFTDEAHFYLSDFVNRQNMRYWAPDNPNVILQKPLHSPKVTVWCGVGIKGIIGPYFFEDADGKAVTVNADQYIEMLKNFVGPALRRKRILSTSYFQQDGATSHTCSRTIQLLEKMFGNRIISKNGFLPWPPRSPDLNACDFFLWGHLKQKVYSTKVRDLKDLKKRIRAECAAINKTMLENVLKSFEKRLNFVKGTGKHCIDVIFKTK